MTADTSAIGLHPQSMKVEDRGPTIWGLDAVAMHDAWWRGRGVQCVHLGSNFEAVSGAELYLLLESDQIVTFALSDIIETIVWSHDRVFRIRVIEHDDESYKEEVFRDAAGRVTGIRRRYARDEWVGYRVMLTPDESLARAWAREAVRRKAKRRVLELARNRVSRLRAYGHCFDFKLPESRVDFFSWLVASWDDPDRVLDGVREIEPGVFALEGTQVPEDMVCIEPAWIGFTKGLSSETVIVGPDHHADETSLEDDAPIRPLPANEIQLPRGERRGRVLPRGSIYEFAKRAFDIMFALGVLVGLFPVIALVSIAVAVDDGVPLFFGHVRQKRNGVNFKCWKFRTMRRDAESMVAQLQAMNKADGPQVFIENDPRVTRVGNILRKLQLDELPQFWNVLKGDMSVVGPRPSPDKENQFCPAWREMRLSVRPGITGLWQVERTRAPGEDFQEWIKYDIEYVRTASLWLDMKIIYRTVRNIVKR